MEAESGDGFDTLPDTVPSASCSPVTPSTCCGGAPSSGRDHCVSSNCCFIDHLHPEVKKLIFWRCPIKSGVVLTAVLSLLVSLTCLSVISVVAYASLACLSCTFAWRLYHQALLAIKKTDTAHPFQDFLDRDVVIPKETVVNCATCAVDCLNARLAYMRHILSVTSVLDTAKFAFVMYLWTFLGAWFNLITLVIVFVVVLFTVPRAYEQWQPQIDRAAEVGKGHLDRICTLVKSKLETLPFVGRKAKTN